MAKKIESKTALSCLLAVINALIILPIIDRLGIGYVNALSITILSIGVFLIDSRRGNLNRSFLSSLVFMATALTLDNAYKDTFVILPMLTQIFGILLITGLFFLTPFIVNWMLKHFQRHPEALLITGRIIATVATSGAVLFILLKSGLTLNIEPYVISITQGWTFWSLFVTAWIFIQLYQIWRNKRDLTANHRFLYNAVALYLLSLIIYIGYIRDAIIIQNL